jgi:hypothetical protein
VVVFSLRCAVDEDVINVVDDSRDVTKNVGEHPVEDFRRRRDTKR